MSYRKLYRETNEQAAERFLLMTERIARIAEAAETAERYAPYFQKNAAFLLQLADIYRNIDAKNKADGCLECSATTEQGMSIEQSTTMERHAELNDLLYADIMPEAYAKSYSNPEYAADALGGEFGVALSLLAAHIRGSICEVFRGNLQRLVIAMELFVEVYNSFEHCDMPSGNEVRQILYWYFHDYSEIFIAESVRRLVDPDEDFETKIVMESDLTDLTYLYRYGAYIGDNEKKIAVFLNGMSEEKIQAMADTYTEGYRIGFEVTGKELAKKQVVQIRYPIGFERMVRAAVKNFEKMGLRPTMLVAGTSPNKQFDYDHREDRAYYLDKAYVERCLEVRRTCFEEEKKLAAGMAGPAVIEVFGEEPFSPENKKAALKYSEKQQQLYVYETGQAGQITNRYIRGEECSFTIIAYPLPEIGDRFEEIFAETVKINTLDYALYRDMQQKMIDVLDQVDKVRITGKGENKTDLYVNIWELKDSEHETAFENCVADVNIPVGEVFTSPVLTGTCGKLFVSQVYLNGLNYQNLEIDFLDGMASEYTCTNFADEAENKKYIRDNVLAHHETLPMGEFAIGTNTTAYRMARDYQIADKLPILIAEKTGPHFAVGDTCYSHEEDNLSYNPDGKAIVARENAVSALRATDMEKAYFNCHTDITIPYDELDKITVIRRDGSAVDIIADGRFALVGTEELNRPLDR